MGFSANQARFLSLTSRQVDLEYRMQQICHRRLRLASELEKVATEYNNALSDRRLYTMETSQSISNFTVDNVRDLRDNNGNTYEMYAMVGGQKVAITGWTAGAGFNVFNGSGTATTDYDTNGDGSVNAGSAIADDGTATVSTAALGLDSIATDGENVCLEEAIRRGIVQLVRVADSFTQEEVSGFTASTTDALTYETVDWRTMTDIADELYRANDVDAEAEYEGAVQKINSQDKKLQLEQSQIEVEHKAITTQKDAVKNIINKNIESSFKTFS